MKKFLFFYCLLMSNVLLSMRDDEAEDNYPFNRLIPETNAEKEAEIKLLNQRYQSYGAHLKKTQLVWQAVKENREHTFEKNYCCSCNLW